MMIDGDAGRRFLEPLRRARAHGALFGKPKGGREKNTHPPPFGDDATMGMTGNLRASGRPEVVAGYVSKSENKAD